MNEALVELGELIAAERSDEVVSTNVAFGELTVNVRAESLDKFLEFLRNDPNCKFEILSDVCVVD